ncbi:hypothetical protein Tco_0802461 [Tanacetum coccineum]|uniref:Uncharacterized protein n=1 Tax=Tanacetum coccineum TaxID=301880 RepID=A0ABQ5A338_9ASTR
MAQKFKKASPSKKDSDLVSVDEEPITKGKRVKRAAKKSTTKPAAGVVIREALVETKSKNKEKEKEKEKVDVTHGKGIELLFEVALTKEAQMKEKVEATLKSAWTEKDHIDNLLIERRLMRSLEKFVGGRLYMGDLRLLQRTI